MSFNGLFYPLRLNADVSLCYGGAAVLQEALHKGNVIAVVPVNLRCVPFPKAMGADSLIAQVITDAGEDLLHFPCRDGKQKGGPPDPVPQAIVLHVLINHEWEQ